MAAASPVDLSGLTTMSTRAWTSPRLNITRWRATTSPSPPLFPPPQTMAAVKGAGVAAELRRRRQMTSAIPRPAFSINSRLGRPVAAIAATSVARICEDDSK